MTLLALVVAAAACNRFSGRGATPKTEDEKTLYGLGVLMGKNLATFDLSAQEVEFVKAGLADTVLKRTPAVDPEKYGMAQVDKLASTRSAERSKVEKGKAAGLLEAAAREPGAVKLPSGTIVRTTKPGTGEVPGPNDRVTVHYEGRLSDGTVFDSSKKRGQPATFPLNGVVKCWTEGVGHMKVGEQAQLTCPSDAAYGESGRPPVIPGGATLIFDVELISIAK
jgi:FKBP-type peptidyl-prolyl cis-trans isomerase FkpA